jgi:hypothetical protein
LFISRRGPAGHIAIELNEGLSSIFARESTSWQYGDFARAEGGFGPECRLCRLDELDKRNCCKGSTFAENPMHQD